MIKGKQKKHEIGIEKNLGLWQNIRKKFEVELYDGEVVLCSLNSHWWCYAIILYFAVFNVAVSLMSHHDVLCVIDIIGALMFFYFIVWVEWQGVIFTNRRVICRNLLFRMVEKNFALPEITLLYHPITKMMCPNLYFLKVAEDGNKMKFSYLSVSHEQIEFMRRKYKVEEKSFWLRW